MAVSYDGPFLDPAELHLALVDTAGLALVAEAPGGQIAGFLTAVHHGPVACLNYLMVLPCRRGDGVGRALLETGLAELARLGVSRVGGFVAQGSRLTSWLDALPEVHRGKLFRWYESELLPSGKSETPDRM